MAIEVHKNGTKHLRCRFDHQGSRASGSATSTADAAPRLAEWSPDIDAAGCARALSAELDTMADACEHWPATWRHAAEQGESMLALED